MTDAVMESTTWAQRLDGLRAEKLAQTAEKQAVLGPQDHDDWGMILPPPELRKLVDAVSSSGMPIKDCLLANYSPTPNHPSGGFFGAKSVGENYGELLRAHPVYIDARSSLAGGYMVNFSSYRNVRWNPDYDYSQLKPYHERYGLVPGIGGSQHFCQEMDIGLALGWGGLLKKIEYYRLENGRRVAGLLRWPGCHHAPARRTG